MEKIIIDKELSLVSYYPYYKKTIEWYSDIDVCKQVDNIDHIYTLENLKNMYSYLNKNGYLYYIKYRNRLCGDVCLQFNGEVAIVVSKPYQNKHIGRRVIKKIIEIARKYDFEKIKAHIYEFNNQSQVMFEKVGFKKINNEDYIYHLKENK